MANAPSRQVNTSNTNTTQQIINRIHQASVCHYSAPIKNLTYIRPRSQAISKVKSATLVSHHTTVHIQYMLTFVQTHSIRFGSTLQVANRSLQLCTAARTSLVYHNRPVKLKNKLRAQSEIHFYVFSRNMPHVLVFLICIFLMWRKKMI